MYTYVLATFLSVLLHLVVKQRECNGLILMKKKIKQMIHCFYFLLDLVSRQLQVRLANSLQHRINDKWYIPGGQSLCVDFLYITYEFYFFSNCYILSYSNSILKGIFSFLLASSLRQPNTILLQSTNNRIHCF